MLRLAFAILHLLPFGIGLGAVWARGRALGGLLDKTGLQRVLSADNWWGVAALLWLATGLWRAFGGLEKGTGYYLANGFFWAKMGLFVVIMALEVWPMITFIRWRIQMARGQTPDTAQAGFFSRISLVQAVLLVAMLAFASAMARGYGMF